MRVIRRKVILLKLEKQKKTIEKRNNKIIKKILSSYNIDFISQWIKTLNFKLWNFDHNKDIYLRSYYIKKSHNISINYENGDLYNGSFSSGKRNGFGILNDISNSMVYNGNWENDMVNIK